MFPSYIEMDLLDLHVFVKSHHVWPLVVVRTTEKERQELLHC